MDELADWERDLLGYNGPVPKVEMPEPNPQKRMRADEIQPFDVLIAGDGADMVMTARQTDAGQVKFTFADGPAIIVNSDKVFTVYREAF